MRVRACLELLKIREAIAISISIGIGCIQWIQSVRNFIVVRHSIAIVIRIGIIANTITVGVQLISIADCRTIVRAVKNAIARGLIVPTGKGARQISAVGERFIDALPDYEDAKAVLGRVRQRRSRKKSPRSK